MAGSELKFNSRVIHGGQSPDKAYGALTMPIYQTSSFAQDTPGKHSAYEYSRTGNPTRSALEYSLANIENGKYGLVFGSGVAAIDAVLKLLKSGDEVVCGKDLYGGSIRLFNQIYNGLGIKFHYVDLSEPENLSDALTGNTKLIWIETPTNPLMKILDIVAIGQIAAKYNVLLAVDNTFASPYLQKPLDLGADIVMHSATKYLGGHSDVVLGALIVKNESLAKKLYFIQKSCGAVGGPMDSFLVLRGIKTLHVRMQRHCENAKRVARFLRGHSQVEKVYWPGFEDHPNHDVAKRQMKDFGGMVSVVLKGNDLDRTVNFIERLKLFTLAESLGGVESLAGHPVNMSHASVPEKEREENGIVNSLVRLSVGIEDVTDLVSDLKQALG